MRPDRRLLQSACPALLSAALLSACGGGGQMNPDGAANTAAATSSSPAPTSTPPGPVTLTDVLTYHNDTQRTGQNLTETALTPASVNAASFGKLRLLAADGKVDAAPLIANGVTIGGTQHNVVYVASEHDSLYAYDVDSGALLLHTSLLPNGETPSDPRSCGQVSPEIGITATPVIDRHAGPNGTIYLVAMSKDASGNYYQRLHALDLATLQDRISPAAAPGGASGPVGFDPKQYKERGALLLSQGQVFTVWASHCDISPYNGWIIAYDAGSLAQTAALNVTPNGAEAGIWDVAGLEADSSGALYVSTGNGSFDTSLSSAGLPSQQDYGNCVLKLMLNGRSLSIVDYFTASNTISLSANDLDLGSGSPLLLPDQLDASGQTRHLLLAAGKYPTLYLLDRDNLGHFNASADQAYQQLRNALPGGVYSASAYFNGSVYIADVRGALKAYALAGATLPPSPTSQTAITFDYPGSAPSISANGASTAILWTLQSDPSAPAVLHAYNPADLAQEYYNSNQAANGRDQFGAGNKFITPVVTGGRVFVGTTSAVAVFGLLQ